MHHAFLHIFLAILARLRHDASYFHAPALRSRWTKHKKFLFSFSKLRYVPFEFNPENFANIWQIKWNWIRSMKFETVRIYFLSEFSVCCHPKILLPWQRDVTTSPLYRPFYRYGGHIELIGFKEYYRMPRGHEHISFVFSSAFRDIFS